MSPTLSGPQWSTAPGGSRSLALPTWKRSAHSWTPTVGASTRKGRRWAIRGDER